MPMLRMDGIEVDTTRWIDSRLQFFRNREELWVVRLGKIDREIVAFQTVLKQFCEPRQAFDPRGIAHAKAYLYVLSEMKKLL